MNWARFVCLAVIIAATVATRLLPLTLEQNEKWKVLLQDVPKGAVLPNFKPTFIMLCCQDSKDEMHRVKQYLHVICSKTNYIDDLIDIAAAKHYLQNDCRESKEASTIYYNSNIAFVKTVHDNRMPPIYRAGAFTACCAQSMIPSYWWFFSSYIDSTIEAVLNAMQQHLTKEPKDYTAFANAIEAYVSEYTEPNEDVISEVQKAAIAKNFNPLTASQYFYFKSMMALAAQSSRQPDLREMLMIGELLGKAPGKTSISNTAIGTTPRDRMMGFLRLSCPNQGVPPISIMKMENAKTFLKDNKDLVDPQTLRYYEALLELSNTNYNDKPAIVQAGVILACKMHSELYKIRYSMDSTINTALYLVATYLTPDPKQYDLLIEVAEAFVNRIKTPSPSGAMSLRNRLFRKKIEKEFQKIITERNNVAHNAT